MNERKSHSRHYTYADIKKYLAGNMSLDEMYAFEKAVMDDPFLADALDGYMTIHQEGGKEKIEADLKELDKKLKGISNKKTARGFIFPLWAKSAAAILFLVFLGYLTDQFLLKKKSGQDDIARKDIPSTTQPDTPAGNLNQDSKIDSAKAKVAEEKSAPSPSANIKKTESKTARRDFSQVPSQQKKSTLDRKYQADTTDMAAGTKENLPQRAEAKEEVAAKDLAPKQKPLAAAAAVPSEQVIRGIVIDANSMPVQGAIITLANSNKSATTDKQGEFNLGIRQQEPKINLVVNALGYSPREIEIAPDNLGRNIIELSPDSSSVKEIVVSEFRKKQLRESSADLRNSVDLNASLAVPAGGWPAFYEYLNRNKKINTIDSARKGTEIISFQVDKNGMLSSFRAEQSISKAHLAEAIRLVKEGPAWTCLKGKKQRVTVYINFN